MNIKQTSASILGGVTLLGGGLFGIDSQINPYTEVSQRLEITKESTTLDAGKVKTIAHTNEPKITLEKWNGEVGLGIKYTGISSTTEGRRPFLSENVEWKEGNVTMQAVPVKEGEGHEDGGIEINIILDSVPASNIFTFELDNWQSLDFNYQPALTQEEINEGNFRPENVIGSYAVYYRNHNNHEVGGKNYATGKFYHIYRPLVTDNGGNEVWATLSYHNGTLSVTVPQDFLDNAVYPVKVDPTFGYTTCGGTRPGQNNNTFHGSVFTSPSSATSFVKLTACGNNGAGDGSFKGVVVLTSSLNIISSGVGSSVAPPLSANSSFDLTYSSSPSISPSTSYILGQVSSSNNNIINYDASASQGYVDTTNSFTSPTNPTDATSENRQYSIYATYIETSIITAHTIAGSIGGGAITTGGIDTTGANLIVIAVSYYQIAGVATPTDSKSNTWTALTSAEFGIQGTKFYYSYAPTVGSGHTFTESNGTNYASIAVVAIAGAAASPFDVENMDGGSNQTTSLPGPITPSQNNEIILTGMGVNGNGTDAINSGYTITDTITYSGGNHQSLSMAYLAQTTAASTDPTWSGIPALTDIASYIASFKTATAAANTATGSPSLQFNSKADFNSLLSI